MTATQLNVTGFVVGCAVFLLSACGGGGSGKSSGSGAGSGFTGTYTSVNEQEGITIEFKSGGRVDLSAEGAGSSSGTFTVEGEKLLLNLEGQHRTFIRDGDCLNDPQDVIGKVCKGGKAGEARNVSTRSVPTTPTGIYVGSDRDGEFRIEFKSGGKLTLTATPTGGARETHEGTFIVEGDVINARFPDGTPLMLKFVNDAYESTSFGFPIRFVKQ